MEGWSDFGDNDISALLGRNEIEPMEDGVFEKNDDAPIEEPGDIQEEVAPVDTVKRAAKKSTEEEKPRHSKTVKYTDSENEQIEKIKTAIGTDKDSKALRWALSVAWRAKHNKIERIVEEKGRIETL